MFKNDSKSRIIEAAKTLIYKKTYVSVGVAAICEQAKVQKGSFYHFFSSKSELTLALLESFFESFQREILQVSFLEEKTFSEQLELFIQNLYAEQHKQCLETGHTLGCPFGNLAMEMAHQDAAIEKKVQEIFSAFAAFFMEKLTVAKQRDEIKATVNVEKTAWALIASLEGTLLLVKSQNDPNLLLTILPSLVQAQLADNA